MLPFRSPAGSSSLTALADGITADLSFALANGMRAARIVTPSPKGEPRKITDARALGFDLKVRYLIDGELQPMRDSILVTTRVIEADSAQQIGGVRRKITVSRWDNDRGALIAAIAKTTREAVWTAESRRVASGKLTNTPADLVSQGNARLDYSVALAREARTYYDRALQLDPKYVPAWIGRGWTFETEFDADWTDGFDRERLVDCND